MRSIFVIALLLFVTTTFAQDDAAAAAPAEDAAENAEGDENKEDECEEAWEYLEFLKAEIKEKIEVILQETLFEPSTLLETTVGEAMTQVLEIRDSILERTKKIRQKDESITICPDQDVNQDQFLTTARMEVMTVLLSLIEQEAATPEKLQEIGKQLLSVRTKVNTEITRIIMLRETGGTPRRPPTGECDCGILEDVVIGLNKVIGEDEDAEVIEAGAEEATGDDVAPADDAAAAPAEGEEGAEGAEGGDDMSPVQGLTMTLMLIDTRIEELYNQILTELDEEKRTTAFEELTNLKDISLQMNDVIAKMVEEDPESEDGKRKVQKLVDRDVKKLRNDVERQVSQCKQDCPSECDSCGSAKIEELKLKLQEHKSIIEDLEDEEAKENIRNDLMQYLTKANTEMTALLKQKAESEDGATLEDCGREELEVLEAVKGPLWMMVNVSIFETEDVLGEMITALEAALDEMGGKYCSLTPKSDPVPTGEDDTCDLEEINKARDFIQEIDDIISENLFKAGDDDVQARRDAMLGIIDLKSLMDDRVRQLYIGEPICHEEVHQIKNTYNDQLTKCLAEMMNPRVDFGSKSRAERVQCVKELRIAIEDRRGVLLLREVEKSIQQAQGASADEEVAES